MGFFDVKPKRKSFSVATKREALERQGLKCGSLDVWCNKPSWSKASWSKASTSKANHIFNIE